MKISILSKILKFLSETALLHTMCQGFLVFCMIRQLGKIYARRKATLCVRAAASRVSGLNDLLAAAVTFNQGARTFYLRAFKEGEAEQQLSSNFYPLRDEHESREMRFMGNKTEISLHRHLSFYLSASNHCFLFLVIIRIFDS